MFVPTAVFAKAKPSTRETALTRPPFIWHNIPFVGRNFPSIIPFVCQNRPFMTKRAGFTLIEMMIALVILGVLATIAAPSMQTFIKEQRISGQANDLIGDLAIARSEAIRHASNVGVCPGTIAGCVGGGNWANGRIVFVDLDNDGGWDAGETILRVRESLDSSNTMTSSGGDMIVFAASGLLAVGGGVYAICDSRLEAKGRDITVSTTGQSRAAKPSADCTLP